MKKHTISLQPFGKIVQVQDKIPLKDVLHEFGIKFPCGGKGICGKCNVKLLEGVLEVSEVHRQKLKVLGLSNEWRLACYSACTSDITLEIEQFSHLILAAGPALEGTNISMGMRAVTGSISSIELRDLCG